MILLGATEAAGQGVEDKFVAMNDQAIELSRAGKLGEAIGIWFDLLDDTSAEYPHRWVFHKNVGRNFQKLGALDRAWWHLDKSRQSSDGENDEQVHRWINELEAGLTRDGWKKVHVTGTAAGEFAPQSDDLRRWYPLPTDWWFKPGRQRLSVRVAPEHEGAAELVLDPETTQVTLEMPKHEEVVVVQPIVPAPAVVTQETRGSTAGPWVWAALATGGALLGAGAGTYWGWGSLALSDAEAAHKDWVADETALGHPPTEAEKDADWDSRLDSAVAPAEVTSYVLWGLGGATLAAGAVLFFLHSGESTGDNDGAERGDGFSLGSWHSRCGTNGLDLRF